MAAARLTWEAYAASWARLHGGHDPRQAGPLARRWRRGAYRLGVLLVRAGASPSGVTWTGLAASLGVPVLAALGGRWPVAAAGLVALAVIADGADGAVAVLTGRVYRRGYVLDSLADRLAEACWLAGFWALGAPGPLLAACGAACWLREYAGTRATAAGLAVAASHRPGQAVLAGAGLLLAGLCAPVGPDLVAGTVTIVAVVWLLLAVFDLGHLLSSIRLVSR